MPPRKSSSFGSATSAESSDPLMLQSAMFSNEAVEHIRASCLAVDVKVMIVSIEQYKTLGDVEADVAGDLVGGGGGDEGGVRLGWWQILLGEGESQPVVHSSHG